MTNTHFSPRLAKGQSLVEMVLITPILLLFFVIAGYIGMGMYEAQMASDAIRQPAMKKWEMANMPGKVTKTMVLGYTNNQADPNVVKGTIKTGALLDGIDFVEVNDDISIVVGNKKFGVTGIPLPEFNFTVAQAINRKLLRRASEGSAKTRPFNSTWLPYGGPRPIPWVELDGDPHLPTSFVMLDNGCKVEDVDRTNQNVLQRYILPSETYIARTYTDEPTPVTQATLMQMADTYPEICKKKEEGVWEAICSSENEDLMPSEELSDQFSGSRASGSQTGKYIYKNPYGGPAMKETYDIKCWEGGPPCKIQRDTLEFDSLGFASSHGLYWDDTGEYRRPPADFVKSCKASKQAMCQLKTAARKAQKITDDFYEECKGF